MNSRPAFSQAALALIAIVCGGMGFAESIAAVPALSTAMAGDALIFLRESALAWLAMWVMVGAFRRIGLIARLVGVVMILLGAGVFAIAVGRLIYGSAPDPMNIAGFGMVALAVQLTAGALALRYRQTPLTLGGVWRASRDGCFAHLMVIAAAASIYFLHTNVGDIAVGAAIGALFAVNGLTMLVTGRLAGPAEG